MPRAHGRILSTIWSDPDWVARSSGAQRLYLLLLSQPKLTLVGLLTHTPSRWARLAADSSLATVEAAIAELEASRFVVVDRHTDELLVRTLVRHDITALANGRANQKLVLGLWRAWSGIESLPLRSVAAHEIPDSLWEHPKCSPPAEAVRMRRSAQIDPPIEPRTDVLSSLHSPLSTDAVADNKQPGDSRPREAADAAAVDNPSADVLDQALDLLVARELERNPTRGPSAERHAKATKRGKAKDHLVAAHRHLGEQPRLTAVELADLLEPPPLPTQTVDTRDRRYDDQQRAQRQRAEENMTKLAEAQAVDVETDGSGLRSARDALRHREAP